VKRFIISFAIAVAAVAGSSAAHADDPAPTPAQIEKAKKAFAEGKQLHEKGKLPEAIEKFKESYALSKNPLLLYNIGVTMEEAGMDDLALFYYRKFLAEAPADAAPRESVVERTKALEKKFGIGGATSPDTKPEVKQPDGPKQPVEIKPPGTYSATDFQHQVVDTAPPAKPLDVTAFVPEDSGFTVTLNYRTAGEGKFTAKEMRWRYKELVARVPAPKMIGDSVQYYIEVKDQQGNVVTRSGKSTSPNLITLEPGAPERFYPDFTEEGEAKVTVEDIKRRDDEDDPLGGNKSKKDETIVEVQPQQPGEPGSGFRDVGSSKFKYAKWGTTAAAGTLVGLAVFSYIQAGKYASSIEEDSLGCGSPPCRPFSSPEDSYPKDLEATGKRYQTISNVTLGLGVATAAVAGYFWYKELTAKKRGELKVSKGGASPETASSTSGWVVVPSLGDGATTGFLGGTAATRF